MRRGVAQSLMMVENVGLYDETERWFESETMVCMKILNLCHIGEEGGSLVYVC